MIAYPVRRRAGYASSVVGARPESVGLRRLALWPLTAPAALVALVATFSHPSAPTGLLPDGLLGLAVLGSAAVALLVLTTWWNGGVPLREQRRSLRITRAVARTTRHAALLALDAVDDSRTGGWNGSSHRARRGCGCPRHPRAPGMGRVPTA